MNNLTKNVIASSYQLTIKRHIHKTHYEVLNLKRDCTSKEIKQSYIELSKKYHPDTSKERESHKQFVQVTEAYQVLSKPDSRKKYDLGLPSSQNVNINNVYAYESNDGSEQVKRNPWKDPIFWKNRDKSQDKFYESQPYYGIQGVKRVSNFYIVLFCLGFTCIGVGLQIFAIRHSFTLNRNRMIEVSNSAAANLKQVREEAEKHGNKLQMEIIAAKIKNANGIKD